MALIAWYPLHKDLKDWSGNGYHATVTGSYPQIDNGKIGKTYNATAQGAGASIANSSEYFELSDYTFAAWIRPNGSHNNYTGTIMSSGNWNTSGGNWVFGISQHNTGVNIPGQSYNSPKGIAIPINEWQHVLITRKDNVYTVYQNGIQTFTNTGGTNNLKSDASNVCISRETYAGGHFNFFGSINDLRVYDNALSLKDIKKLAQAKVLHYNFNKLETPTTNIRLHGGHLSNMNRHGVSYTYVEDTPDGWKKFSIAGTVTSTDYPYTFSLDAMVVGPNVPPKSWSAYIKTSCPEKFASNFGTTTMVNIPYTSKVHVNDRNYHEVYNVTAHGVSSNVTQSIYINSAPRAIGIVFDPSKDFVYIKDVMVEQKKYVSEYVETSREGTINDISGLGNNAILRESDSPEYIKSGGAIGSGSYYFDNNLITTNIQAPKDEITMSLWVKSLNKSPYNGYHIPMNINSSDYEFSIPTGNGDLRVGFNIAGTRRVYNYNASIIDGEWHLLTSTFDGSVMRGYVDGVQVGATTHSGKLKGGMLDVRLGNYSASISGQYGSREMYQDDIRIYATALSAVDIKELYEVKGSVDKNGGLHANELVENTNVYDTVNEQLLGNETNRNLSQYTQANCSVTRDTSTGIYHIVRPPNLTQAANGNTMWGGVLINNHHTIFSFKKDDEFRLQFKYKGQSTQNIDSPSFQYTTGHTTWGGLRSVATRTNIKPYEVGSTDGKWVDAIYHFKVNEDILIAGNGNDSSTAGVLYDCMRQLKIGWGYGSTGALGTDIYIKDFELIMVDSLEDAKKPGVIGKTGIAKFNQFNEINYIPSKLDYSTWVIGSTSGQPGFGATGQAGENLITVDMNPWGDHDVIWEGSTIGTNTSDGGFNSSHINLDPTKHHRYSHWIRRKVQGNGSWYLGCSTSHTENLSGTANTNPYFISSGTTFNNEWFLVVAYLYAAGTTDNNTISDHGIYNVKGERIGNISTNYRMKAGSTQNMMRSFLHYATVVPTIQQYNRPRIDVMDGSQPSLEDLISGAAHPPIIAQYNKNGNFEDNTARIKKDGSFNATEFSEV